MSHTAVEWSLPTHLYCTKVAFRWLGNMKHEPRAHYSIAQSSFELFNHYRNINSTAVASRSLATNTIDLFVRDTKGSRCSSLSSRCQKGVTLIVELVQNTCNSQKKL